MKTFELEKTEWYKLRDDRTNRVEDVIGYEDCSIGIIVDPRVANAYSLQCMALISCNITARWCRNITVEIPDCKCVMPNQGECDFKEKIKECMTEIDPYGQFMFREVQEDSVNKILVIGDATREFQEPYVWSNGSGWIAGAGYGKSNNKLNHCNDVNPIGPAFASCMGIAEVFYQIVNSKNNSQYETWYSLYDFSRTSSLQSLTNPTFSTNLDLGNLCQIGCGGVGSSLDFLISLTNWKADITLIDNDKIDYTNCNSSLPFSVYHAQDKIDKVNVCSDILQSNKRHVDAEPVTYNQYTGMKQFKDNPPDIILCLANEEKVWSTIQDNFPPLVLHATTTPNWGINFGRHIPRKEWCILCRFSKHMEDTFIPKCANGVISTTENKVIFGSLPFLSSASAVLVLAELAKLAFENYPVNDNFIDLSMMPQFEHIKTQLGPNVDCICKNQSWKIYQSLRGISRFWRLVE